MFYTLVNYMPMLAESTDDLLKRADFVFNVLVPIGIGIMILGAIFGKKNK